MLNKDDIENSLTRIARVKRITGTLLDNHVQHECTSDFCDPCSEEILVQRRLLQGPIVCNAVYLCNYRVVHVCTVDTCDTIEHGVCRISGACYGASGVSSYDKTDSRTWRTKTTDYHRPSAPARIYLTDPDGSVKEKEEEVHLKDTDVPFKKPRRAYKLSIKTLDAYIERMTKNILYSKCRSTINNKRSKKSEMVYIDTVNAYKLQCIADREPINLIKLMLIDQHHNHNNSVELLPIEVYNIDKIQHYVHICRQVFIFVQKYWDKKICFDSVILAILYGMKRGYTLHGNVILPQDMYLTYMLPLINDLPSFGISKKYLTAGQDLLDGAFLDAIDNGTFNFKLEFIEKEVNEDKYVSMRPANYRKLRNK